MESKDKISICKDYLISLDFKYIWAFHETKFFNIFIDYDEIIDKLNYNLIQFSISTIDDERIMITMKLDDVYSSYISNKREKTIDSIIDGI